MSVSNGQRADQTTFNNAFLSKVVGGETVGVIDLNNTTDPNSGAQVPNTQRAVNELYEAVGSSYADGNRNQYSSNNYVVDGDSRKAAIERLDTQMLVASTNAIDALAEGVSLRTLSGTTSPATDLGTFTGTTITDAVTVKAALQELETAVEARILLTEKGAANGVATLDAGGKIPTSQVPASFVSLLGDWNASTNTPTLANGVGDPGDIYRVSVAGTVNFGAGNISFSVGDWVYYRTDNVWDKTSNVDAVTSVNGLSGTVTLDTDDIGEGATNLYFTNARVDTQIDARRGVANGVASLDASTLVPIAQIPDITTAKVTDFGSAFDTRFDSRIPTKSIDVLSDVDTTTVAPATNDFLKWNGANWVPAAIASGLSSPVITLFSSGSGTYTPPVGVAWLRVKLYGGGGGGAANGSGGPLGGSSGQPTTFDTLTANGGEGGQAYRGGGGGSAVGGNVINLTGAPGQGTPGNTVPALTQNYGGSGGGNGGGLGGTNGGTTGGNGTPNTGGGGGGGGTGAACWWGFWRILRAHLFKSSCQLFLLSWCWWSRSSRHWHWICQRWHGWKRVNYY
jgi:hypothetical protein